MASQKWQRLRFDDDLAKTSKQYGCGPVEFTGPTMHFTSGISSPAS